MGRVFLLNEDQGGDAEEPNSGPEKPPAKGALYTSGGVVLKV